jgi:hypothetical protein
MGASVRDFLMCEQETGAAGVAAGIGMGELAGQWQSLAPRQGSSQLSRA